MDKRQSLLQVKARALRRNKRIREKDFFERMYKFGKYSQVDLGDVLASLPRGLGVSHGAQRVDAVLDATLRQATMLRLELYQKMLREGVIYSYPCMAPGTQMDDAPQFASRHKVFQLLEIVSFKKKVLRTYDDKFKRRGELFCMVQFFGVWGSAGAEASTMDVHPLQDPCRVNFLSVAPWGSLDVGLRAWSQSVSDVSGCVEISSPSRPTSQFVITDRDCPVLLILQALRERGWAPSSTMTHYAHDGPKKFWSKNIGGKRFYLQCLLDVGRTLQLAGGLLRCDQVQDYYLLLLSGVSTEPGLRAIDYKKRLSGELCIAPGAPAASSSAVPEPAGLVILDADDGFGDMAPLPDASVGDPQDIKTSPVAHLGGSNT